MAKIGPLELLLKLVAELSSMPFFLLTVEKQQDYLSQLADFQKFSEKYLQDKNLGGSQLAQSMKDLGRILADKKIDEFEELALLKIIYNVCDFYSHLKDEGLLKQVVALREKTVALLEILKEKEKYLKLVQAELKQLSPAEIEKRDKEIFQKVGSFYILEYHLQMYYELTHSQDRKYSYSLIENNDTKIKNGTLMGLRKEMESREFVNRFAYKVLNNERRQELLKIFYQFNFVLKNFADYQHLKNLLLNYQAFIIKLLEQFNEIGIKKFKGIIYSPYGQQVENDTIKNLLI